MKATSLFTGGGVGETYLDKLGFTVTVANEIIEKRALFYKHLYPETEMIIGSIQEKSIKNKIIEKSKNNSLLLATPPCQGFSTLVAATKAEDFKKDQRNFLIYDTFEIIDSLDFDCILIENVPRFLKMLHPYKGDFTTIQEIITDKYSNRYQLSFDIFDAKDYKVPQFRKRAVIKMFKKNYRWPDPKKFKEITVEDAIGHLPSLESGEDSGIKYHISKVHNEREIMAMRHTPTGQSAFKNKFHFPKKLNGDKVSGFHNTYKRLEWDKPCKARTTNNGNIGSHNNVHPGRKLSDGTYSDARVLTLLELFIVSSLPKNWNVPDWASENMVRQVVGEGVPPKMMYEILKHLRNKK